MRTGFLAVLWRVVFACVGLGGLAALACFAYAVSHLFPFEWRPLRQLLGLEGVFFVSWMIFGLVVLVVASMQRALAVSRPFDLRSRFLAVVLGGWLFTVLWLADWVFLEQPLTVRLQERFIGVAEVAKARADALAHYTADGSIGALAKRYPQLDRERIAVMLARIAVNRPSMFEGVSIGEIISEYAERYHVSPALLLHWSYIDSFYGEAPAGPMPFFAEVNGELFRDLVQAHLPPWFIESRLRIELIEGPWLSRVFPNELATKLRYALQKATYDIAISPYMNSVLSDLFLVLKEYPQEFPEVLGPGEGKDPLGAAFHALRNAGLMQPYHDPYSVPKRARSYYDQHRNQLMAFARAAVYRLITDFSFATKAQALIARYYSDQYSARLGEQRWRELNERQQTAMLAMLRDVYTPSIGKLSYDLYLVPEFNTTPINYLAENAAENFPALLDGSRTWEPTDPSRLWGATGLMIRVLGETWGALDRAPLPGLKSAETIPDAIPVLARNKY